MFCDEISCNLFNQTSRVAFIDEHVETTLTIAKNRVDDENYIRDLMPCRHAEFHRRFRPRRQYFKLQTQQSILAKDHLIHNLSHQLNLTYKFHVPWNMQQETDSRNFLKR
jgi:hypothetical protein